MSKSLNDDWLTLREFLTLESLRLEAKIHLRLKGITGKAPGVIGFGTQIEVQFIWH